MTTDTYQLQELLDWRKMMDDRLRADDGWLTVAGLHWLKDGENSVGSDPTNGVVLPADSTPAHLGVIDYADGAVMLTITTDEPVFVEDNAVAVNIAIPLRTDTHDDGPTVVRSRDVSFFIIDREGQLAVRVKDKNNPPRLTFEGRQWYAPDPSYRVIGKFAPHSNKRTTLVETTVGMTSEMETPGYVDFTLHGTQIRLEAFEGGKDKDGNPNFWFVFRDATSGKTTYPACRFMYSQLYEDGTVLLDFNRCYSPPCAFTAYATCPMPPRQNNLQIAIEAGERDNTTH
ncbi:MAG: DUF1684 domain-containing protein [Anaerolineae bacterium]|nr:DUF1684 domain-containing protein [Anaerolineae bacterium]